MNVVLEEATRSALGRLDDEEAEVWSVAEMNIYIKDGCDLLCRRTKPIFDMFCVENLPAVGNYSSDEEFEMARKIPGLILTNKRQYTREIDATIMPPGLVGPAGVSTHKELEVLDQIEGVARTNPTGQLPRNYVDIERVTHDGITLYPEYSSPMGKEIDNRYESATGTPSYFTIDKDGIFTLRRYPGGDGEAVYSEVQGYYGVETYDDEYTGAYTGDWGALVFDPEHFPSGGPWGSPTRTHPDDDNTIVELYRLALSLDEHVFDLPESYIKYVEFWACSRALRKDGPGQNIELANHFADRFEIGIERLRKRVNDTLKEYSGRIGRGPKAGTMQMQINLPYNYGIQRRRRGRY